MAAYTISQSQASALFVLRNICVHPTEDEVLCKEAAWLPGNFPQALHPFTGAERLLDTHFRLLRNDALQPFMDNARELLAELSQGALSPCRYQA